MVGYLILTGEQDIIEIYADGKRQADLKKGFTLTITASAGPHEIIARKFGYTDFSFTHNFIDQTIAEFFAAPTRRTIDLAIAPPIEVPEIPIEKIYPYSLRVRVLDYDRNRVEGADVSFFGEAPIKTNSVGVAEKGFNVTRMGIIRVSKSGLRTQEKSISLSKGENLLEFDMPGWPVGVPEIPVVPGVPECITDAECPAGQKCVNGKCVKMTTDEEVAGFWNLVKEGRTNVEDYGPFAGVFKTFDNLVNVGLNAVGLGFLAEPKVTLNIDAISKWILFSPLFVTGLAGQPTATVTTAAKGLTPSAFLKDPGKVSKWFVGLNPSQQEGVITLWKATPLGRSATTQLLRTVVAEQGKTWLQKAIPWLAGAIAVMGTTTFMEFLYEEALQSAGMGIWVAISNKQWNVAAEALDRAEPLLEKAEFIYSTFGYLAPYSFDVFNTYAKATRIQYGSFRSVIAKNLGSFPDPSKEGKVFDMNEFKRRLAAQEVVLARALTVEEIAALKEEVAKIPPEEIVPEAEFKIIITSTQENSKLYVDNVYTHHWTPSNEKELSDVLNLFTVGQHTLRATKAGYSGEKVVNIVAGDNGTIYLDQTGMVTKEEVVPAELPPPVVPVIEEVVAVKIEEIPVELTTDQKAALQDAFIKIENLTKGPAQMSTKEYNEFVEGFALYTMNQKQVLDMLFKDVWVLIKGVEQMTAIELADLKIKYKM